MSVRPGDLARRGARGGAGMLVANALQLVIAIVTTMVLARQLPPAVFGHFAMAMVAFALVAPVRDFGLPAAIVQRRSIAAGEWRALRRWNLRLTVVLALVFALVGELCIRYFEAPELRALLPWLIAALAIRALANPANGLLQRELAYARIATVTLVSVAIGAALAVWLAAYGAGASALAVQQFATLSLESAGLLWCARRLSPGGEAVEVASGAGAPGTIGWLDFTRSLGLMRLVSEWVAQVDRLVLGRLADAGTLGLYQNALRWSSLPLLSLMLPLGTVGVAMLARLQHAPARYASAVRELFESTASIAFPVFAWLAIVADPLIPLLLGPDWTGAVPLFRLLALAALFESIDRMATWLHLADGRTPARLRFALCTAPLLVLGVVAGGAGGAIGVAWALLLLRAALCLPSLWWAVRATPLGAGDVLRPLWRPAVATLVATGALLLAIAGSQDTVPPSALGQAVSLLRSGGLFGLVYVLVWVALPGGTRRALRAVHLLRRGA